MPFVGTRNGDYVGPYDVEDGAEVYCPQCGGPMGVKATHKQGSKIISRHFFHKSSSNCSGESDAHIKLKTIAKSTLDRRFPEAEAEFEVGVGDRVADVLLEFPEPKFPYGRGIVVEAQVKHKDKDFASVFREYEEHGFSTYVAYLSDIQGSELSFRDDRLHKLWPHAVPPVDHWNEPIDYVSEVAESVDLSATTRVWVPEEYIDFRRPEFLSPRWVEGSGWSYVDSVDFHSYGRKQAWWDLWSHPEGVVRLELWEEDTEEESQRFQTMAVIQKDVKTLYSLFVSIAEMDSDELYDSAPYWETVEKIELTGAPGVEGWLSLSKPPNSDPVWILGRADPRGNTSTIGIEYRNGDEERMRPLGSLIERAISE